MPVQIAQVQNKDRWPRDYMVTLLVARHIVPVPKACHVDLSHLFHKAALNIKESRTLHSGSSRLNARIN